MAGEKNMVILASSYNIGGFEIKLDYLIRNLDKKKFNITFLLVYPLYKARHLPEEVRNKYRAFLSWDEVNLIELDMKYRYDVSLIFKVAGLLRKMQADILYYTSLGAGTFIAPAAALIAGVGYKVKEVQTILKGQYPAPLRGIDQYLTSRMDRVIVASYFLRDLLVRKLHLTPAKIQVVPNGIDLQKFRKTAVKSGLKEQMDLPRNARIVGMIANLVPIKDHMTVLRAIPRVLSVRPETVFLFFGEGPLHRRLQSTADEMNISSNVRFMGYCQDLEHYIPLFDIGLLASKVEIHPISLIEIMASGVPVVAPCVGGIPEIVIDNETGLLTEQGNDRQMAECILRLLNDPGLSKRLGKRASERVRLHFQLSKMVRGMEEILTGGIINQ